MTTLRTVVPREATPASADNYGLSPELLAKARGRVARLATLFGALSFVAILLNLTVFRGYVSATVIPQHVLALGLALVVIVAARAKRLADTTALNIGLLYEVFLCWTVSFSAVHAAVEISGRPPELTWAAMIIVIFPMIVPLPPQRLLGASILGALGAPASLLVLDWMNVHPLDIEQVVSVSLSPTFAVTLAYFGARMIYAISVDASRARLLGSYQLESPIGAGGMGEVWKAKHHMLARPAAIKLIGASQLGHDAQLVLKRFEQEAQATALLRSPHTVEVYDFGRADDGSFYYVMELLDGVDLQQLVTTHGPVPAARVVHILRQVSHSLAEAHAAGLVHRDIKPANILLCRYGNDFDFVKVLDFGLVKHYRAEAGDKTDPNITNDGLLAGTPAYLYPEAITGAPVDARSDIYSLGCVAYWLLTGELVFPAETPLAMLTEHVKTEPTSPAQRSELPIPADLEALVLDCLAKAPGDRPAGAEEVARRLDAIDLDDPWDIESARQWWELRRD